MMIMKLDKTKLSTIIEHFGRLHQIVKLGEEVGELNKAILDFEHGFKRTNNDITEEIADVYLLLEQVKIMYNLDKKEIKTIMEMKLDRTLNKYCVEY